MSPLVGSSLKDVYWMSSPLKIEDREAWSAKLANSKYVPSRFRKMVDPSKELNDGLYGFFPKIKHWTLEIDGQCYELWPTNKKVITITFNGMDICEPQVVPAKEWWDYRKKHDIDVDRKKVGQTKLKHKQIERMYTEIWDTFYNGTNYEFFTQNCQNFAAMLHRWIAVEITETEQHLWDKMPDPASHLLSNLSTTSLAGRTIMTGRNAYLAAIAGADAIEAGSAVAGGAVATTTSTTATTAVAADSAGVAGATSTQAVGAQTAAVGTQSTGAGTATAAKGSAAGAGKAGLGAKLGAISHGAGAAKLGMAAKGVGAVAMLHPVTGTITAGALIFVAARGRRDKQKKWERSQQGDLEDEEDEEEEETITAMDALEAENNFIEKAENPNSELDHEVDEDLAEGMGDLGLTQVSTEPASTPGRMSVVAEDRPTGTDPRRQQTVI